MPLRKSLKGSQQEAFTKDSNLMQQAREDYFKTNHPCFDHETSCNLSDVFWDMISLMICQQCFEDLIKRSVSFLPHFTFGIAQDYGHGEHP